MVTEGDEDHTSSYHVISATVLPTESNSSHIVTKMEFQGSGPQAHVYIGTETDIFRVPVQSCSSYSSCCQCVVARDPYCAYDMSTKICASSDSSHALIQDLVGGNSERCAAATGSTDGDTTVPVRTCSGPAPGPGGNTSDGGVAGGATTTGPGEKWYL